MTGYGGVYNMITVSFTDLKLKRTETKYFAKKSDAEEFLEKIGRKPLAGEKIPAKQRYVLTACSWDTKSEEKLCQPYISPEKDEENE